MVTRVAPASKNSAPHASEKSSIRGIIPEQLGINLVSRKEEELFKGLPAPVHEPRA
jgi:hypothetical protein